jgi:hypothetical protein
LSPTSGCLHEIALVVAHAELDRDLGIRVALEHVAQDLLRVAVELEQRALEPRVLEAREHALEGAL